MVRTRRRTFGPASAGRAMDRRFWLARNLRRDLPQKAATESKPTVLFINQYYWPDHASTAQHLTDLAESLAADGYACRVVAGRGAYQKKAGDNISRPPTREVRNGVEIHRVESTSLGRKSNLARMTDYLSFYIRAIILCMSLRRHDVVVTLTTPPIIGLIGALLRILKKSKHVCWSMDLHPDAGVALGKMSRRNPIVALLDCLSAAIYRSADGVVALGPYMADRIRAKGVRLNRVSIIPVWSRRDEVYPMPREGHPLRAALGLEGKFVLLYSGNLGLAHSFDEFLAAAQRLRDRLDIVFLFVGDGPRRKQVERVKTELGLENVRLLDYFPREQLHASLSLADVHLISMRNEMTGIVVPGKLYGAMASARALIFVGPDHCETADAIRQAECGWTVRPMEIDALVTTIERAAGDLETCELLGHNGRHAFLEAYDAEVCCNSWRGLIAGLVERSEAHPSSGEIAIRSAIAGPRIAVGQPPSLIHRETVMS